MKTLAWLVAPIAAGLLLSACNLAGDVTPPPRLATQAAMPQHESPIRAEALPSTAPDPNSGAALFAERCAPCHGDAGAGDGAESANLPVVPPALADLERSRLAAPGDWYEVVSEGRMDRFMPAFRSLSDEARWDVVAHALLLGVGAEALERGEVLFEAECAACHRAGSSTDLFRLDAWVARSRYDVYQAITRGVDPEMPAFADDLSEDERWALAAYVQSLVWASASPRPAAAQPTPVPENGEALTTEGTIIAQVYQGTPGSRLPEGLEVTLHAFDGQEEVLTQTASVPASGEVRFTNIDDAPGRLYILSADYGDVRYASDVVHMADAQGPLELPITIYESTTEPSAIRAQRLHLLIDFPAPGLMRVVEVWLVANLSDRTLAPYDQGGGIEIALPEDASNLRFEDSLSGERYQLTNRGFAYRGPLRAGEDGLQIIFGFDLAYDREAMLEQPVGFPVQTVTILVPESAPKPSADGLQDRGIQQASGERWHHFELGGLAVGDRLRLNFRGRAPGDSLLPGWMSWNLLLGLLALLAASGAVAWWYGPWREGNWQASLGALTALEPRPSRQDMLRQMAALDEAYEAGEIDEATYQRRRGDLKDKVLRLMRGEDD